jgi:hypothetical protein
MTHDGRVEHDFMVCDVISAMSVTCIGSSGMTAPVIFNVSAVMANTKFPSKYLQQSKYDIIQSA